jgi:SAM-dependent methyltransferase
VIPIELISSIYERFIHAADPTKAMQAGTHYTPVNLVDFVLSQVFDDGLFEEKLPPEARVLDLACGSGVFLVEALRRLIARRLAAGEKHTRGLVRDALYNQVYGVDIEESAVEIAAFSLCLTAFELDPIPNSPHHLKFKHELKGRTLFVDDAFDPQASFHRVAPFKDRRFDVVVGNPPWTRPKGQRSVSPGGEQLHVKYCREREPNPIPLPYRNPPEQAFVWRARDFARKEARIGMILEGKRFFSHQEESLLAKRELLLSFEPKLVVNLAALHDQKLFPATKQPALVLVAVNHETEGRSSFAFAAVEFARPFRNHGILQLGPENAKRLSVSRAASNPFTLKVASWGSARDMALIDRLTSEYGTLRQLLAEHSLEMRQGYITGKRSKDTPSELHELPCLTGGGMTPFEVSVAGLPRFADTPEVREHRIEHARDPDIYCGPVVLCASGLRGNRIVAAYCRADLVYSLSQYGVSFANGKRSLAPYINGILNSSLATYFTFLTATKWGIEKYEILENDILRLPIPTPERAKPSHVETIRELERELRKKARNEQYDEALVEHLDEAVFQLYGLDRFEKALVEDMVHQTIDFQRNHEKSEALVPASCKECRAYARSLVDVIQPFLQTRRKRRLVADVLDVDAPLRVVRFMITSNSSSSDRPTVSIEKLPDLSSVLHEVARNLDEQIAFGIYTRRHLRVYSGDTFFILKPSQRRFWTRSAGLTDGDSVLKDLLARGGGE